MSGQNNIWYMDDVNKYLLNKLIVIYKVEFL